MKTEDFDRLRAVCEKEGFEISTYRESDHNGTLIHIKPKNIWEGVEFVKSVWSNKICPINQVDIKLRSGFKKDHWTPSTESAYIEQLKAEAFERFGDINEGDSFDETSIDGYYFKSRLVVSVRFEYYKCLEILRVGNVTLYRKGKWATKLPKRIEVSIEDSNITKKYIGEHSFEAHFLVDDTYIPTEEVKNNWKVFLALKLEEYLNKE